MPVIWRLLHSPIRCLDRDASKAEIVDLSISSRGLHVAGLDSGAGVSFGGDTEDKHSR